MKNTISLLIIICSFNVYSQNTDATSNFTEIILDGKPALMNVTTGEIVTGKVRKLVKSVATSNETTDIVRNTDNHIVMKGETLYSISKVYDISVEKLRTLNASTSLDILRIGQNLVIRTRENDGSTNPKTGVVSTNSYVVEKGDTMYSISKKFSISIDEIKSKNNLTSTLITVGQRLRIK